ncbi:hypothetical protein NE865_15486 [Phthorimaea operculella]|nr:hypothetical protein NE865_15486 [Phthorimaea operculella]
MGKIVQRRCRTPNWSIDEKKCLLEMIKARRDVITRTTIGPTHFEEKDVAWNEILRELARRFGVINNASNCSPNVNDLDETAASNKNTSIVEVKTERIEEDITQPSCSTTKTSIDTEQTGTNRNGQDNTNHFDSSSSYTDPNSEDEPLEQIRGNIKRLRTAENTNTESLEDLYPLKDYQEFKRFTTEERQIKMETLKEERQVIRAMRETAELNKIIAEQRLKHVLWVKKQEMA